MSFWFWHGLRKGIRSTGYPGRAEMAPGISPGLPIETEFDSVRRHISQNRSARPARLLPTAEWRLWTKGNAYSASVAGLAFHPHELGSGIMMTCQSAQPSEFRALPSAFAKSMHIMVVDTGDCGACLHEVKQLNNPLYNIHRLGFFFTATPRTADLCSS